MTLEQLLPGRLQATFWPGTRVPADGHLALWGTLDPASSAAEFGLPPGASATLPTVLAAGPRARTRVAPADVPARLLPVLVAVRALAALPAASDWPAWRRPSDSLLAWSLAAKLACELVAAGRMVPTLRSGGPGAAVAGWRAAPSGDGRVTRLAAAFPPTAHALRTDADDRAVWSGHHLLAAFCDAVADACARAPSRPKGPAPQPPRCPDDRSTTSGWQRRWLHALAAENPVFAVADRVPEAGTAGGTAAESGEAAELADRVAAWSAPLVGAGGHASARLCLRLRTPKVDNPGVSDPGHDHTTAPWSLEYLLQAADDPSLLVPAAQVWDQAAGTLEWLGRRVGDPQESLVRGLAEAARLFPPLDASLSEPRPCGLELDGDQAAALLVEGAASLASAGLGVLLPAELTAAGARRLRGRLRVGVPSADPGKGLTSAGLDADGLGDFSWEVALGDDTLHPDEFAEIVALKQPLVRWRGRWLRVDPDEVLRLADLAGTTGRLPVLAAVAAALAGEHDASGAGTVEVVADGALAGVVERLRAGGSDRRPRLEGVRAALRGYQERGVAWLQAMADLGLGCLLADDMGLGKTLQTIALLAGRDGDRPHLVVCPTSVVGNWERELARFAPDLPVVRHHGAPRAGAPDGFAPGSVVVTSYGTVRTDADLLAAVGWDVVVLDEAQNVKNHAGKAARAVRRLPAAMRVALTGTPVENRLSELWSILDFTTPGLLDAFPAFRRRFAVPVERWGDPDAAERLRRLVSPFLLRRTKSDPAVAADLPAKQEYTVVCSLTREQATLYQATVDTAFAKDLAGSEGIDRRGKILALLTALKQVCNHPAQLLGESGPLPGRSGKLERASEMLAEVLAEGERALVFTQYRRMGELLARHLADRLGLPELPFLHGGVPRAVRDRMVEAFQSDDAASPILLVSLKAGGTGLNLTRATHVLHYDRWWNPAVEDQATDRAHRIGQSRTVTVHKLVTAGTLEERIAELLERKRALAAAVVGAGETWLTELGDDELRELVALSTADVTDDDLEEAAA
jgi:hypothetical protein